MSKIKLLPLALLALSQVALAAEPPSAGSQMQQIPLAPQPQNRAPRLDVQAATPKAVTGTDTATLVVKQLRVTGARAYTEAELLAVTGFVPGQTLSLSDLRGMATKIADYYHRQGYFAAQAYLPEQTIRDGSVTIAVMDGRYGQVIVNNQTNVQPALVDELLRGLNHDDLIAAEPLESHLLLLSDLPGIQVRSTLVPGSELGTSDLRVDVLPGERISGSVDADNAGNRYTGANRVGITVNLNEPAGLGDVATLRLLSSGEGLNYARLAYQAQFGSAKLGVAYSNMRYKLGEEFASLQAHGTAEVASIYGSVPLVRSRSDNLYAGLTLDAKTFQDKVDIIPSVTDKKAQVLTARVYGDHRDNWGYGGLSTYSLALSAGKLDLQTASTRLTDATTAQSNGNYQKLSLNATHLHNVSEMVSLYAALNGQVASKNLDISEKMELGGMYGVRAYPEGEAYGDEGAVLNLEGRVQLTATLQAIVFVDAGTVRLNKSPWATGSNHRTLSGAGLGLNWAENNNFMVRAYYARKLGDDLATSAPDKSGRFWIQAVKYF